MYSLRFALLLVATLASLAASAGAAPIRLFEIAISRFSRSESGAGVIQNGLLNALGQFRVTHSQPTVLPPGMPEAALGKNLVYTEAWFAFQSLGGEAVANFTRANDGAAHVIGGLLYYEVAPAEDANLAVGEVVNLSTRGRVTENAAQSLIGGFIISEQFRRVLIRAVGPSLESQGVTDPVPDPYILVYKGATPHYYNDNWGTRHDADEIAAVAEQIGAFRLDRNSKDAALLLELEPGAYTVHVTTGETSTAPGTGLLEVYVVP